VNDSEHPPNRECRHLFDHADDAVAMPEAIARRRGGVSLVSIRTPFFEAKKEASDIDQPERTLVSSGDCDFVTKGFSILKADRFYGLRTSIH
jgi:ketosteroid isomerase-like protein